MNHNLARLGAIVILCTIVPIHHLLHDASGWWIVAIGAILGLAHGTIVFSGVLLWKTRHENHEVVGMWAKIAVILGVAEALLIPFAAHQWALIAAVIVPLAILGFFSDYLEQEFSGAGASH